MCVCVLSTRTHICFLFWLFVVFTQCISIFLCFSLRWLSFSEWWRAYGSVYNKWLQCQNFNFLRWQTTHIHILIEAVLIELCEIQSCLNWNNVVCPSLSLSPPTFPSHFCQIFYIQISKTFHHICPVAVYFIFMSTIIFYILVVTSLAMSSLSETLKMTKKTEPGDNSIQ